MAAQAGTVITGIVGCLFFFSLAAYVHFRGGREVGIVVGAVLIGIASLNMLIRGFFFPNMSPSPASPGGFLRLLNGLVAIAGAIVLERGWRKQRRQP